MSCHFHRLRKLKAAKKAQEVAQGVSNAQASSNPTPAEEAPEKASKAPKKATTKKG